ncbi:type III secretion system gatekeeper subunit SctW [Klebsiella indica]|uniref:YopN family type III secretion system gatekeeper subunit n=2 Tax=Klebsiella/Raoultella group TaxID=2890311 RepID=A0A5R9LDY7_9ENTR|nr:type III secretion system gatekeeper subunit SctW [Klebsiella indica]TLV11643.1 YopN family type III secretion system gatekeeper subunit [Klebsiella indica]
MKITPVIPSIPSSHLSGTPADEETLPPLSLTPAAVGAASRHMPASPLEDSMEEVSMTFAEQVERKSKSLNQRRVTAQPDHHAQQQVERIEKLNELLQLLEHPQHARLETQTRQMQTLLLNNASPHLADLLHAAGDDPARCDVLLRHTLQHAQQTQDSALAGNALSSLERLHQAKGAEVHAGLNTASAIASFSTDPGQKQAMRQLYYRTIVHLQSGNAMLDAMLGQFGSAHITQGLRTLQRALADDIAARNSSIPRRALQTIRNSLQDAGNISQTLSASKQLLERLSGKLPTVNISALDLTRRLLNLSGNGTYLRDLQNLAHDTAGSEPQHQVLFLSGLVPLVYHLPQGLWRDDKTKNRQMALNLLRSIIGDYSGQEPRASLTPPRTAR